MKLTNSPIIFIHLFMVFFLKVETDYRVPFFSFRETTKNSSGTVSIFFCFFRFGLPWHIVFFFKAKEGQCRQSTLKKKAYFKNSLLSVKWIKKKKKQQFLSNCARSRTNCCFFSSFFAHMWMKNNYFVFFLKGLFRMNSFILAKFDVTQINFLEIFCSQILFCALLHFLGKTNCTFLDFESLMGEPTGSKPIPHAQKEKLSVVFENVLGLLFFSWQLKRQTVFFFYFRNKVFYFLQEKKDLTQHRTLNGGKRIVSHHRKGKKVVKNRFYS